MSLRNGLLGLAALVAMTGSVLAAPPVDPLVEGREPNPVVREFHETEPLAFGYALGLSSRVVQEPTSWVGNVAIVWELLLDRLTMPLGTALMPNAELTISQQ